MSKGKLFLVSSIAVLFLAGVAGIVFASTTFLSERHTIAEGTITEETEVVDASDTVVINELAYDINEIVTEAGVIVEEIEVINPQGDQLASPFTPIDVTAHEDGAITFSLDEPGSSETGASTTRVEIAEGIITEVVEVVTIARDEPELTLVDVYINEVKLPQGTIAERVEVYGPLSDDAHAREYQDQAADFRPLAVFVDKNDPQKIDVRPYADSAAPLSWSVFIDTLYATCSSGAKFEYLSSTGTSVYTLRWSGGEFSNDKTCSGSQCHYTISTSWNAYYTYADAQILAPAQVWGPANAYRCN
jgi:putative ubiquitin-RnfH superfamily antitoxin RatB of RatAB toxin-antitoxin module